MRHLPILAIVATALLLPACMIVPKPTVAELQALDHPPPDVQRRVDAFMPRVMAWQEAVETDLLPKGRPLTADEIRSAQALGVREPQRVRVLVTDDFPMPTDPALLAEARTHGLGSPSEGGRSMGRLVLLKPRIAGYPEVLRHELVHVAQRERLGAEPFMRRYLTELVMMGYARSPLELEAYARQGAAD